LNCPHPIECDLMILLVFQGVILVLSQLWAGHQPGPKEPPPPPHPFSTTLSLGHGGGLWGKQESEERAGEG
jgi:hypothetical protein